MKPHTKSSPCAICDGYREQPPGHGVRCFGFLSSDGDYAHCSRSDCAGPLELNAQSSTYAHRLHGTCKCGTTHGEDLARVTQIGTAAHVIEKVYDYTNAAGELVFQAVRYRPKGFRQRKPNGRGGWEPTIEGVELVPYRLPELIAAVDAGDVVWICEGEKDCDTMHAAGHVATCNAMGAGKWRDSYSAHLAGADVVIVRDKDDAGTKHARQVFASLRKVAKSLRVVEARTGKDATDHLAAGHTVAEFVPVWPVADLRAQDPVAWKRRALRMSLDAAEPLVDLVPGEVTARPKEPTWPTGLGDTWGRLPDLRGVAIVAGMPSAGKSVLALGSGVDAAHAGWDVIYLSCEMAERPLVDRLRARCGDHPPESFGLVNVGYGASVEKLIDWIEPRVGLRPTLVIFDSVSSFCDQAEQQDAHDAHGIGLLKRVTMWAVNVRRATFGQIGFMLLAEASKEGRARGRFADHKADIALLMETADSGAKRITVTKSWESFSGEVGEFAVRPETARLEKV